MRIFNYTRQAPDGENTIQEACDTLYVPVYPPINKSTCILHIQQLLSLSPNRIFQAPPACLLPRMQSGESFMQFPSTKPLKTKAPSEGIFILWFGEYSFGPHYSSHVEKPFKVATFYGLDSRKKDNLMHEVPFSWLVGVNMVQGWLLHGRLPPHKAIKGQQLSLQSKVFNRNPFIIVQ